ncbi:MAG: Uncharacterised protein [Rhodothermaeota bacterium MED-G12]|nr:MAG: Uncharacterised protein [Rhodothermaeota bacterium MED-G12]
MEGALGFTIASGLTKATTTAISVEIVKTTKIILMAPSRAEYCPLMSKNKQITSIITLMSRGDRSRPVSSLAKLAVTTVTAA